MVQLANSTKAGPLLFLKLLKMPNEINWGQVSRPCPQGDGLYKWGKNSISLFEQNINSTIPSFRRHNSNNNHNGLFSKNETKIDNFSHFSLQKKNKNDIKSTYFTTTTKLKQRNYEAIPPQIPSFWTFVVTTKFHSNLSV